MFVVEQAGRIRIIRDDTLLATPFLDITSDVSFGGERGLFGVAFHPDYADNGRFYVHYTNSNGDTRVVGYVVSADPDRADPASATTILAVSQPFANHNGGQIRFGPDGMLWIALGDGGSGGDPQGNGQDPTTLLGALLRLDVDGGSPYAIPPDNPFANDPARRSEIWAFGLRNPWRFAFDEPAGVVYIADVGQNRFEEVSVIPLGQPGANLGWNVVEGDTCFATDPCDRTGLTAPVLVYDHGEGCSIVGGYVNRGPALAEARGHYLYSDFCAGFLRSFRLDGSTVRDERTWEIGDRGNVLAFGEDAAGRLYLLTADGVVFRLAGA